MEDGRGQIDGNRLAEFGIQQLLASDIFWRFFNIFNYRTGPGLGSGIPVQIRVPHPEKNQEKCNREYGRQHNCPIHNLFPVTLPWLRADRIPATAETMSLGCKNFEYERNITIFYFICKKNLLIINNFTTR
jgi:hypothetical protein